MLAWVALGAGVLMATLVSLLGVGLAASLPVVLWRAAAVIVRREGVPLVYNVRSLRRRGVTTLATLAGLVLVIFLLTSVLMLAAGIEHSLGSTGNGENVKVWRKAVRVEGMSWISGEQLQLLSAAPQVALTAEGKPRISPEALVLVWAAHTDMRDPDDGANLTFRGITPDAFEVHPPRALEGRRFNPGTNEVMVGKALVGRFEGARLGGTLSFAGRDWPVVGVADQAGTAHDSEVWGDIDQIAATFRRGTASLTLTLKSADDYASFAEALQTDSRLSELQAKREGEYWQAMGGDYPKFVRLLGGVVGLIFSFGAILGAMNTMYAQVSARTSELGTLRAIGFKPRAILTSLVFESVLLALFAGVIGVGAAAILQSVRFTMTTVQTLTEMVYRFHLSPGLALSCVAFSALMGYAGGLLPAWRAARMPIVEAVRAD